MIKNNNKIVGCVHQLLFKPSKDLIIDFRNLYEYIHKKKSNINFEFNNAETELYFITKHLTETIFGIKSPLFTEIIHKIK